jgi:hypothetical protein
MTNANSSNVTPIESKQPAPAARFQITASIDGFPVQVEVEGKAGDLRALVDRLKAIGAEPPQIAPAQSEPAKKVAPVCPDHGTPMKASRKPGSYFCPRQTDGGEYCDAKA